MKQYQNIGILECLQGDTLPSFQISIEKPDDFSECLLIIEDTSKSKAIVLEKACEKTENGFFVQLTSEDTANFSGLYKFHFKITDNSGLQYRKIAGNLNFIATAQG